MERDRRERVAMNEAAFRSINETLSSGLGGLDTTDGELAGLVCECGDANCSQLVHVSLAHYQRIRQDPHLFLIVPGHDMAEVEDVVERGDRHAVVRKHADTSHIVEQTDPRR